MTNGEKLVGSTVILQLELRSFGSTTKVDSNEIQSDADKKLLRVSKALLSSDELSAIKQHDAATREWVKRRAQPSGILKGGFHLVSVEAVEEIEIMLALRDEERRALVERLCSAFDSLKAKDRDALGSLFNESDYPLVGTLKSSYAMRYSWMAWSTPDTLKHISTQLWEKEREKAAKNWDDMASMATQLLTVEVQKLVEHLVDRLATQPDGKRPIFRDSLVEGAAEFLDHFNMRNVLGNEELQGQVDKMKALLSGVDPEKLRKDEGLRESVALGFQEVKTKLDEMIVVQSERKITLE
jgi:hypothetical protein